MGSSARRRLLIAAAAYAAVVLVVGWWPTPVDLAVHPVIDDTLARLHARGAPPAMDYSFVETIANVGLFVPLGLLVTLALPRPRGLAVLAGALLSGLVEAGQALALPSRYATLQDVVANTAGAAAGTVIALGVGALLRRHRSSAPRSGDATRHRG